MTKKQPLYPHVPKSRRTKPRQDELRFLPDSPEFLTQTIEDIGYRNKIDSAFKQAIARVKD